MYQVRKTNSYEDIECEKKLNISKFFELKSIIIYILAILIGTCKLSSGATPFGLALLGAIADTGFPLIIPLILIGISSGIKFGGVCLAKFAIASILFITCKSFVKGNSKFNNVAKMMISTAISEVVILLASQTIIYDGVMAAFMTTTTAIFYLIFSEGLPVILDFANKKIDSHETLMAAGILVTVVLSSVGDFSIFGLSLRSVICIFMIMMLGWRRGMTVGVISGVSISLVLGIMGLASALTVATYAICGMLSGIFSKYGRVGAIVGFILGNAIWVYYINASTEVIIPIKEIVLASFALMLVPNKLKNLVDDLFEYGNTLSGNDPVGLLAESTIYKLNAVSDVANDMAENVLNSENPNENKVGNFVKILKQNTCKKCDRFEKCWKENYHLTYEMIFNAQEMLHKKGMISKEDVEGEVCTKKSELAKGINFSYEIYKVNKEWEGKANERKELVAKQLRGVSKAIDKVKDELFAGKDITELLSTGYNIDVGVAGATKKGSETTGDAMCITRLKDGKMMVALSDGMGTGKTALKASKKVLALMEKYLNAGLERQVVFDLINSYLLLGENNENFATLDVIIFNPETAIAEFIKMGACPTYIKGLSGIEMLSSASLPIGANVEFTFEVYERKLEEGDVIAMVTDGIIDASVRKEVFVKEALEQTKKALPQRMADMILQEALDKNLGIANDDMTIVIMKII